MSRCCSTCIVRAAGQQKQYMVFSKAKGKPTTREDKPPRKFTKTDISRTMSDGVFLKEVGICHPNRAGAAGGGTKTRSSLKGEVDGWPDFSPCNKPFIVKPSKRGSAQPSQPPLIRKLQDGLEAAFGIFKQHGPKVSSTFYMVDTPQPYKLSKFEGSEEELKAFRDSQDKDNCAAELFPTCLVEPVQVDDTPKMTKQEKEAHATWGIQAVRATVCGTQLTGAGVKVCHSGGFAGCKGCSTEAGGFGLDHSLGSVTKQNHCAPLQCI